jgi:hypothetical protein
MFSSIIRLGIAIFGAAILSSCGGSSGGPLTLQSTPEGLFTGTDTVTSVNPAPATNATTIQNMLVFVANTGIFYAFYFEPNSPIAPATLIGAAQGTVSFSGGGMTASNTEELSLQSGTVTYPSFAGAYNTGINIAGTFSYPLSGATSIFNINYDSAYQGVQDLSTLAGTYTGTVGTSGGSEAATFTFGTANVPANSGNQLGVATIVGVGADGCQYTGTVSPLYKGNGYTTFITSGPPPCLLPNTEFSGLIYLDTANNLLYSYAPDTARLDGLIFTGTKN